MFGLTLSAELSESKHNPDQLLNVTDDWASRGLMSLPRDNILIGHCTLAPARRTLAPKQRLWPVLPGCSPSVTQKLDQ